MRPFFTLLILLVVCNSKLVSQNFYDINTIQKIEISFNQSNWDYILDTAKQGSDSYTMSKWVKINGVKFDSAGVKYKGNSSYNPNNAKNPFHIELDHFVQKDYLGYKDIKLSNGYNEPSFVREVLLYNTFQNYGKASKANFAQVIVNGVYMGVYTNVEAVTKSFLEERFYTNDHAFVFGDLGGCDLRYKGNDTALYYTPYTLKSDYGWTHLKRLCDSLKNNINGIENILDVDRTLWHHAYNNAFVTLDSYLGNGKHNYYIYQDHNGRFNPILWDMNGGIGIFNKADVGPALTLTQMENLSPVLHINDSMWPLVKNVLAVPMFKRMYIAHFKTIVNENLANGSYSVFAQTIHNIIDTAVLSDPFKFGTYTQFQNNLTSTVVLGPKTVPGIFPFMNNRLAYLNSTPEFLQVAPTISGVASSSVNPVLNSTVFVTATIGNATAVYIGKRNSIMERFRRTLMFDDGAHGDGAASDGVYGIDIAVSSAQVQYYIYAENANAGFFSPQRAEHEFHVINAAGVPTPGQIVINEFLTLNTTDVQNEFNTNEDWIELYNNTSTPLSLNGFYLTDNFSNKVKFAFTPTTVVPANGFLTVWADEVTTPSTNIHASFKLSENGEQIMLSNGSGIIIDSLTYGNQTANVSTGRCPDGTGAFVLQNQTSLGNLNCGVGVKTIDPNELSFEIYPNPASDVLNVNYKNSSMVLKKLEVYDITGRKLLGTDIISSAKINTSTLQNGTYLIHVIEGGKLMGAKKFVIIR
ncbi:MAG: CotH kinase family protein [Bacteroidia bacterium]|nr:CotH kinase family protein [Bacteroidia bacterium]